MVSADTVERNETLLHEEEVEMKTTQFTLPKSLLDEFKSVCAATGFSMKDVVGKLMNLYILKAEEAFEDGQ